MQQGSHRLEFDWPNGFDGSSHISQNLFYETMVKCYLTASNSFSACHRLHSDRISAEENVKIFSKCNNANGHGHNYKFEVTLFGEIDPITGMVMNLSTLKDIIQSEVMAQLDHRNLDKDVAFFLNTGTVSTTENVCVFIWKQLEAKLPEGLLYEVKVHETDKNTFTFRGDF